MSRLHTIFRVFMVLTLFFFGAQQAPIGINNRPKQEETTGASFFDGFTMPGKESTSCIWDKSQNFLHHLSKVFVTLAFLGSSNDAGVIYMHVMFIIGFIAYGIWSYCIACAADVLWWSFACIVFNVIQLIHFAYAKRPVKFDPELEEAFLKLFRPFRISRRLFKKLVNPVFAMRTDLQCGEAYAVEDVTNCDRISLLLSGMVHVSTNGKYLHSIKPYEFIDSMEYEASPPENKDIFKVSIHAASSARYIYWQRYALESLFAKHLYLKSVIPTIATRHNVNYMIRMNRKVINDRGNHLDIRLHCILRHLLTLDDFQLPFSRLTHIDNNETEVKNIFLSEDTEQIDGQSAKSWLKKIFFEDSDAENEDDEGDDEDEGY